VNELTNIDYIKRQAFDTSRRYSKGIRPFVESHRGCNKIEPENTIAAFRLAIEIGCDSIELDVWLTKDKVPIVIHGKKTGEIDETTNGCGRVNNLTYDEISKFRTIKDEAIPTLKEVFLLCKNKIFINVEIKDTNYSECFEKILEIINEQEMKNQLAISSFKHQYWEEIKKCNENIEFGFLYEPEDQEDLNSLIFDSEKRNSTINIYYKEVSQELVKKAHDSNIAVHCWFKMNDEETEEIFRNLFSCGVDVVCTNSPDIALKIREEIFGV
jgi:glycerophosphoryl diester phosphodiesterase